MAKQKYLAIIVAFMVILAGGIAPYHGFSFNDDKNEDNELPEAIPGVRYDPR